MRSIVFGLVDCGVRGRINDHSGPQLAHRIANSTQVAAQVAAVAVQRDEFAQRRQNALEFPVALAVFSEKKNFHGLCEHMNP